MKPSVEHPTQEELIAVDVIDDSFKLVPEKDGKFHLIYTHCISYCDGKSMNLQIKEDGFSSPGIMSRKAYDLDLSFVFTYEDDPDVPLDDPEERLERLCIEIDSPNLAQKISTPGHVEGVYVRDENTFMVLLKRREICKDRGYPPTKYWSVPKRYVEIYKRSNP